MGGTFGKVFVGMICTTFALLLAFYVFGPAIAERIVALNTPKDEEFVSNLDTNVERTQIGDKVHLKVTVLVPSDKDSTAPNSRIFFYGLIGEGEDRADRNGDCGDPVNCKNGYPAQTGPFAPGSRQTIEVDLPRSFVERKDAHFHLGLGPEDNFYPSNDLLRPQPAPVRVKVP